MPIWPYTHVIHFPKLGSCFTFMFLLIFLILHAQKSIFGVVQQVGKEYFRFGSLWQSFGSCNGINILKTHGKRRLMFYGGQWRPVFPT